MKNFQLQSQERQRGIATLLVLILVGIAISAAVFGSLRYIQGAQNQTTALHSQTQAQMHAWAGVEIIFKYLEELDSDALQSLVEDVPDKSSIQSGAAVPLPAILTGSDLKVSFFKEEIPASGVVHLYARITGESAKNTRAHSTSTIEVVYLVEPAPTESFPSCQLTSSTVFRGDLSITGGTTEFMSGENLADIAVEGNVTLGSASQGGVSGCATGNVTLSGGGIKDNATFYVGGDFNVSSMTPPKKATVWAKNINIGNTGQGEYTALKAGAYQADVYDGQGSKIGTASVGGKLIPATAGPGIPWATGTILPFTDHNFIIDLNDGTEVLIKMGSASVDQSTGMVSSFSSETISGEGVLPETLKFVATGISGGKLDIYTLTIGQLWGHAVSIKGWDGKYNTVLSNGNFNVVTGTIENLTGGGNLHATNGGCSSNTNCWSYPTINNPSNIAGTIKIGSYVGSPQLNNFKVTGEVANTSPGLAGSPYCDTRTNPVVASDYKNEANYIFEMVGGKPQLTIQKVELSNGVKLDGTYDLSSEDLRKRGGFDFLACGWSSNHCFRNNNGWDLTGIYAFPPGIAWFDNSVTINGVDGNRAVSGMSNTKDILATFISAGTITLTQSGHGDLMAPNFNPPALCQGNFRPTNLCTKAGDLATWTDSDGTNVSGLPLGNVAILAQAELDIRGWNIDGHVIVGVGVKTGANQGVIRGGLVVGANDPVGTSITQGGLRVDTRTLSSSQRHTLCGTGENSGSGGAGGGGWKLHGTTPVLWTRYM